jgi:hypothetical protein
VVVMISIIVIEAFTRLRKKRCSCPCLEWPTPHSGTHELPASPGAARMRAGGYHNIIINLCTVIVPFHSGLTHLRYFYLANLSTISRPSTYPSR